MCLRILPLLAAVILVMGAAPPPAPKPRLSEEFPVFLGRWRGPPTPLLPKIDPATPLKDLLPTPPAAKKTPVYVGDDLRLVPEVAFEAVPAKKLTTEEWRTRMAHTVASALHLAGKEDDGYLKAALKGREDLAGMPFVMGGACRTMGPARKAFKEILVGRRVVPLSLETSPGADAIRNIIDYADLRGVADAKDRKALGRAIIAATAQLCGGGDTTARRGGVRKIMDVPLPEAVHELARLAVFSFDEPVRELALEALSARREPAPEAVLLAGLDYPWPEAAANAADAIVKLKRKDLIPHLVARLDAPDPRAPRAEGKSSFAREVVRVNHHRNCLMCHAPASLLDAAEPTLLTAAMPVPNESFTSPGVGYGGRSILLVRIDVTYLRQDFSELLKVEDAAPWPEMQRFDFVVRKRALTEEEAADLRKSLEPKAGEMSPYRQAALNALRKLTGSGLGADAAAWRKHLKLPPA